MAAASSWSRVGCIAALFLLPVAGELIARAAAPHTGSLYDQIVVTGGRFKMKPSRTVSVPERYGTVEYTFNRDGYRDGDHDAASSRQRIVLLGDSVTFGLGVRQDEIYPAVLQRLLDERRPGRFEVDNLAIFAYHTGHELETLREDGLELHPAIVVVQFFMNDFVAPADGTNEPPPTFGQRAAAVRNRLLYRSALVLRVQQLLERATYLIFHDARRRWAPSTLNKAEPRDKQLFLRRHADNRVPAFERLRQIDELARSHHARLLVLVSPDESQLFDNSFDDIDERIARFGRRVDIPIFDVLPVMRRATREDLYLDGVHLTPTGHRLVAGELLRKLQALGWLDGSAAGAT